eukprot:1161757-Pelagomonas_calceolata.AAC.10
MSQPQHQSIDRSIDQHQSIKSKEAKCINIRIDRTDRNTGDKLHTCKWCIALPPAAGTYILT